MPKKSENPTIKSGTIVKINKVISHNNHPRTYFNSNFLFLSILTIIINPHTKTAPVKNLTFIVILYPPQKFLPNSTKISSLLFPLFVNCSFAIQIP
jgi:hypothetical protein